jgi:hypothetical protein
MIITATSSNMNELLRNLRSHLQEELILCIKNKEKEGRSIYTQFKQLSGKGEKRRGWGTKKRIHKTRTMNGECKRY